MSRFEFYVDRIEEGGLVIGRAGYADVPIGTVFTLLTKERLDGDPPDFVYVDLGPVCPVQLILSEVQWFRKSLPAIPSGHAAGLRLEGDGMDRLKDALLARQPREVITLRAGRAMTETWKALGVVAEEI